ECAPDAIGSSTFGATDRGGVVDGPSCGGGRRVAADRLSVVGALSGRRPAVGGSQFGATALPASTAGRANRADRPVAAAADDGGGHCPHSWSGPLYGGARAAPAGSEPPGLARAQAAGDPLRAREAG